MVLLFKYYKEKSFLPELFSLKNKTKEKQSNLYLQSNYKPVTTLNWNMKNEDLLELGLNGGRTLSFDL